MADAQPRRPVVGELPAGRGERAAVPDHADLPDDRPRRAGVGPLIGLAGYEALHHHIRPLLVIAIVPAIGSALLVGAVREHYPAPLRSSVTDAVTDLRMNRPYVRAVGLLTVFGLVNFPDA